MNIVTLEGFRYEMQVNDQFFLDHGLYISALDHVRELKLSSIVHPISINKLQSDFVKCR